MAFIPGEVGFLSTVNRTTTNLGIAGIFTGTFEDTNGAVALTVSVVADQASATDGLAIQFSLDGTTVYHQHLFSVAANAGQSIPLGIEPAFVRVVYTNGAVAQTSFRLETMFHTATPLKSVDTVTVSSGTITVANLQGDTGAVVSTAVTTAGQSIAASDPLVIKRVVWNNANIVLFVRLGAGATTAVFSYRLPANTGVDIEGYTGQITAIRAAGSGDVLVTSITG